MPLVILSISVSEFLLRDLDDIAVCVYYPIVYLTRGKETCSIKLSKWAKSVRLWALH